MKPVVLEDDDDEEAAAARSLLQLLQEENKVMFADLVDDSNLVQNNIEDRNEDIMSDCEGCEIQSEEEREL